MSVYGWEQQKITISEFETGEVGDEFEITAVGDDLPEVSEIGDVFEIVDIKDNENSSVAKAVIEFKDSSDDTRYTLTGPVLYWAYSDEGFTNIERA